MTRPPPFMFKLSFVIGCCVFSKRFVPNNISLLPCFPFIPGEFYRQIISNKPQQFHLASEYTNPFLASTVDYPLHAAVPPSQDSDKIAGQFSFLHPERIRIKCWRHPLCRAACQMICKLFITHRCALHCRPFFECSSQPGITLALSRTIQNIVDPK